MRLQICGLKRKISISGTVRLVEPIPGKIIDFLENFLGVKFRKALILRPGHKPFFHGFHHGFFLFPHRLAEKIGFRQGKVSDIGGDPHNLLLVYNQTVGFPQNRLQFRKVIFNHLRIGFAFDKILGHSALKWSGPVKRIQGDQIPEIFRPVAPEKVLHSRAFKLKNSVCISFLENSKSPVIIQGNGIQINVLPGIFFDLVDGVLDNGKIAQAQNIHF